MSLGKLNMNKLQKLFMWAALIMLVALVTYALVDKCGRSDYDCRNLSSEW